MRPSSSGPSRSFAGSGSEADFESERRNRGVDLFELAPRSPQLSGCVERDNGAWRYEFHASWDTPGDDLDDLNLLLDAFADESDTFRPHRALDGQTPADDLRSIAAQETPASHMS